MRKILLIATIALALAACKKSDKNNNYPHADWVTAKYEKSAEEQTFTVNITSYGVSWSIKPLDEWCSVNKTEGDESAVISLTIEANTATEERVGKVAVLCTINGAIQGDTLYVTQASEPWAILFSPQLLEVSSEAGREVVEMTLNRPYEIENLADYPWLKITEAPATYLMESRTLSVEYEQNTALEFRRADLRFAIPDTTITSVFTLYQFGTGSRQSDSLALVSLYNGCDGRNWSVQWDLSLPMTQWKGVTMETTPAGLRVTSLDLTGAGLNGTLPASICDLSYLRNLWLGNNALTGTIPADIDRLQTVQYLYLYGNRLTGGIPASIGNMTSLLRLHLYANELTGTIPESLGNLKNLIALGLLDNDLDGTPPASVGSLPKLKELYLNGNRFTGTLPETYSQNDYYLNWEPSVNICPQQDGYGFDNCK
ncbi:MAG: hypothetical protein K2L01_08390 [Rikenellaceae bacterium]|nr:hypothetical protein [Rikenellaceae bacterium]